MTNIITIAGQKGGTGKSTTALNLAVSMALFEKRTLLIDCDPQGHVTLWSGISVKKSGRGLVPVLSGTAEMQAAYVKTELKFLDILPSGFNLFNHAMKLANSSANEKILRLLLKDIRHDYDYIILDSPSSYGFLSVMAMTAADWLLVCMSAPDNDIVDFRCLLKTVKYIRATHNVPLRIAGVLFNKCSPELDIHSFLEVRGLMDIQQMVYRNMIPDDVNIVQSTESRLPVAMHNIQSPAAQAYLSFAEELDSFFN